MEGIINDGSHYIIRVPMEGIINDGVAVATWHKPSPHFQEQRQLLATLRTLFSC